MSICVSYKGEGSLGQLTETVHASSISTLRSHMHIAHGTSLPVAQLCPRRHAPPAGEGRSAALVLQQQQSYGIRYHKEWLSKPRVWTLPSLKMSNLSHSTQNWHVRYSLSPTQCPPLIKIEQHACVLGVRYPSQSHRAVH